MDSISAKDGASQRIEQRAVQIAALPEHERFDAWKRQTAADQVAIFRALLSSWIADERRLAWVPIWQILPSNEQSCLWNDLDNHHRRHLATWLSEVSEVAFFSYLLNQTDHTHVLPAKRDDLPKVQDLQNGIGACAAQLPPMFEPEPDRIDFNVQARTLLSLEPDAQRLLLSNLIGQEISELLNNIPKADLYGIFDAWRGLDPSLQAAALIDPNLSFQHQADLLLMMNTKQQVAVLEAIRDSAIPHVIRAWRTFAPHQHLAILNHQILSPPLYWALRNSLSAENRIAMAHLNQVYFNVDSDLIRLERSTTTIQRLVNSIAPLRSPFEARREILVSQLNETTEFISTTRSRLSQQQPEVVLSEIQRDIHTQSNIQRNRRYLVILETLLAEHRRDSRRPSPILRSPGNQLASPPDIQTMPHPPKQQPEAKEQQLRQQDATSPFSAESFVDDPLMGLFKNALPQMPAALPSSIAKIVDPFESPRQEHSDLVSRVRLQETHYENLDQGLIHVLNGLTETEIRERFKVTENPRTAEDLKKLIGSPILKMDSQRNAWIRPVGLAHSPKIWLTSIPAGLLHHERLNVGGNLADGDLKKP